MHATVKLKQNLRPLNEKRRQNHEGSLQTVRFNFLIFPCMQKRVSYTDAKCAWKSRFKLAEQYYATNWKISSLLQCEAL